MSDGDSRRGKGAIIAVLGLIMALGIVLVMGREDPPLEVVDPRLDEPAVIDIDAGVVKALPSAEDPPSMMMRGDVRLVTFTVPGESPGVVGTIGGPGVYPAFQIESVNGVIPLPGTFEGEELPLLEAWVRTRDGGFAFWDFVAPEVEQVELLPAHGFDVHVVDDAGQPVSAEMRLGHEVVGFLHVEGSSDAQGKGHFKGLPRGTYTLTSEAKGFLRDVQTVEVPTDHPVEVVLETGSEVRGVVSHEGRPVSGAFVVISSVMDGRLIDIVATDHNGFFQAFGLPALAIRAVAHHPDFVPRSSGDVDLPIADELIISMEKGVVAEARVVDTSGAGIAGALVEWRDADRQGAVATGPTGVVSISGVSQAAEYSARLGKWLSSRKRASFVGEAGLVELTLDADLALSRIRLLAPMDLDIREVSGQTASGSVCVISEGAGGVWNVQGCRGEGVLEVRTSRHGTFGTRLVFGEDQDVDVPGPARVEVRTQPASAALERFEEGRWIAVPSGESGVTVLTLLPGTARLRASAPGYAEEEGTFTVPGQVELTLEPTRRLSIRVIDEQGALITGAYLRRWASTPIGPLRRSGGQLPAEFELVDSQERILAVDARRGEALTETREGEVALEIRNPVMTTAIQGRPSLEILEGWLGARLVRDGMGWMIDVTDPQSVAGRSGIPRGAWIVDAWEDDGMRHVVVWHSKAYQTIGLID